MEEQAQIIQSFYKHNRRMPSYTEICELFGYKSKNAAAKMVQKLQRYGVLEKDPTGRLIPSFNPTSLRLLGYVEAGFPSPVEEQELDTMTLDDWLVADADATYILRVKGDSMIDASIANGDYVLVERTSQVRPGDIVVACIDGEWTLKYLREKNGDRYLEAANEEYEDMHPQESLQIEARVISVIRKY
jgi:repressor LexA